MTIDGFAGQLGVVLLVRASGFQGSFCLSNRPGARSESHDRSQGSHAQGSQSESQEGSCYGVTSRLIPLDRAVILG